MNLTYAFGGTREAPLVRRTVAMSILPSEDLQEKLLERTDLLMQDLCTVFDDAWVLLASSGFSDAEQLNVAMGAASYAVSNIIVQSPSTNYALMYGRVQTLLNARPEVAENIGAGAARVLSEVLLPHLEALKAIDATFARGVPV